MKIIQTEKAPAAIGPYSQAIEAGGFVYTSGQLGIDPASGTLPQGIEAQAEQALKNVRAILESAGLGLENTVKTTCFLKDMRDFSAFNAIYGRYFTGKPARSCVEAAALPKGGLVEIEVVAAR